MKPLIVLLTVFAVALLLMKIIRGRYDVALCGRIAMSAMLIFSAAGHFAFTKGMVMMLPTFVPFKTEIIYLTGAIECMLALGLYLPNLRMLTGWLLIIFLLLVLPANIYAAVKQVDYQHASYHGNGLRYLWFRIPLQILFIGWAYFSAANVEPLYKTAGRPTTVTLYNY